MAIETHEIRRVPFDDAVLRDALDTFAQEGGRIVSVTYVPEVNDPHTERVKIKESYVVVIAHGE